MELILTRRWRKDGYTIGDLTAGRTVICNTLEDTDRGLAATWDVSAIRRVKVAGATAIPTGRYRIVMAHSPAFSTRSWAQKDHGRVPLLEGVKGFDGIRIHPGNSAAHTRGCILLGLNTERGRVTSSQAYYRLLLDNYLLPAWRRGEDVYITVR